jgi:hypothetical protein
MACLSWDQPTIVVKKRSVLQPRLSAWYGDVAYSYSGATLEPSTFPTPIEELAAKIYANTGIQVSLKRTIVSTI